MALTAMTLPILPGKKDMWQKLMEQITTEPGRTEFVKSRNEAGIHERSFLQEGPNGDFVILTFEGEDPEASFAKIMASAPDEFKAAAAEIHGLDMSGPPPPANKLIIDTRE